MANSRSDTPPRVPSRPPHAPSVSSSTSLEPAGAVVPAYLSDSMQDVPTLPFATPLRRKQGPEEEKEYSHTKSELARCSPWNDAFDHD